MEKDGHERYTFIHTPQNPFHKTSPHPPPLPRARGKTDVTKQLNNTKTCLKRN